MLGAVRVTRRNQEVCSVEQYRLGDTDQDEGSAEVPIA